MSLGKTANDYATKAVNEFIDDKCLLNGLPFSHDQNRVTTSELHRLLSMAYLQGQSAALQSQAELINKFLVTPGANTHRR